MKSHKPFSDTCYICQSTSFVSESKDAVLRDSRGVKPLGREVYLRIRGAVTLLPPHVFTVCTGSSWLSLYLLN